ncbi:hypothetical protein Kpho02_59430 [Kitasatospora phosalacinea]|uniref:Uncharacterized protein n=1 Tax=Kitasatospora phosalacinea TaxID=2065 RepID=A0A9W6QEM8_9ACTN|nr:hypothetical protein [Kitasatospora phosalacinea]GLW73644.1 hypothetical protein Kpho02_59430 [Kitasatospora phosalacinea]
MAPTSRALLARQWEQLKFSTAVEARSWASLLGVYNAPLAGQCRDGGLDLNILHLRIEGMTLARRLRAGESFGSVRARAVRYQQESEES